MAWNWKWLLNKYGHGFGATDQSISIYNVDPPQADKDVELLNHIFSRSKQWIVALSQCSMLWLVSKPTYGKPIEENKMIQPVIIGCLSLNMLFHLLWWTLRLHSLSASLNMLFHWLWWTLRFHSLSAKAPIDTLSLHSFSIFCMHRDENLCGNGKILWFQSTFTTRKRTFIIRKIFEFQIVSISKVL